MERRKEVEVVVIRIPDYVCGSCWGVINRACQEVSPVVLILEDPFTASKKKTVSRDISMLVIHFPWGPTLISVCVCVCFSHTSWNIFFALYLIPVEWYIDKSVECYINYSTHNSISNFPKYAPLQFLPPSSPWHHSLGNHCYFSYCRCLHFS